MVAAQSARLRGFVGLARDSKQVSTLGSASTRGNRQANELPAEWSSDERVFWRVLKPTRPLTGSSIRLLIGMGSRRRSASQAIDLPSDGGVNFERLFTGIFHTVIFRNITDDAAWVAGRKNTFRNVSGDHTPCPDDRARSNAHAR